MRVTDNAYVFVSGYPMYLMGARLRLADYSSRVMNTINPQVNKQVINQHVWRKTRALNPERMQHMLRHSIQNGTLPRRYGGDSGTALNTGIFIALWKAHVSNFFKSWRGCANYRCLFEYCMPARRAMTRVRADTWCRDVGFRKNDWRYWGCH